MHEILTCVRLVQPRHNPPLTHRASPIPGPSTRSNSDRPLEPIPDNTELGQVSEVRS